MPYKDRVAKRERHRDYMRERYANDPVHRAKHLVRVSTKYVERAELCERCGNPKPEGHHPNYDKPDLRIWLCRDCHMREH